jgi:hypothetical protein
MLVNYQKHREKYEDERKDIKKGWTELLYSKERGYNTTDEWYLDKAFGDRYNKHNRDEVIDDIPYWDTKENDAYWSLSKWQRLKLYLKYKVKMNTSLFFPVEFIFLNLLIILVLTYYANKKSKQFII